MFPTEEEALKIALTNLPTDITVHQVTDQGSDLRYAYGLAPGCWYVIYTVNHPTLLIIQSSSYIAISKVDGRVIQEGSANDEG